MNKSEFGERLRELRAAAELSQSTLAKLAGVSQSHISQWEAGVYAPSVIEVPELAAALGVDPGDLFKPADGDPQTRKRGHLPRAVACPATPRKRTKKKK